MPDDPGEQRLIQTLLRGRPSPRPIRVEVDAGDDAAVLPGGQVLSVDTMVEGVHWDHVLSPQDVGWKLAAAALSDLGAMGARPRWCLLAASLPRPLDLDWAQAFSEGLHAACARWGVALLGGDVTRSPGPRVLSLTVGGQGSAPVTRSGARPGDQLWVSGTLGDAAYGFARGGDGLDALRRPQPPIELGIALAEAGLVTAMMDLSDGLKTDLLRLCAASDVGAEVVAASLPAYPWVATDPERLALQTTFGEDYQLLFAAPALHRAGIEAVAEQRGVQVTAIGRVTRGTTVGLDVGPWPATRFQHFGEPTRC